MIKDYNCGTDFIADNKEFLETNKLATCFFFLDAPDFIYPSTHEYALKVYDQKSSLVCLKVSHYHILLFGDSRLIPELVNYQKENSYDFHSFMADDELADAYASELLKNGLHYKRVLHMDMMDCTSKQFESSNEVINACEDDLDEICELDQLFIDESCPNDEVHRERILEQIHDYYLIKENGKILSMARFYNLFENYYRVAVVYTRKEARGRNLAFKVVSTITNKIIDLGGIATLNVDKVNPISNHLYKKIGYTIRFAQSDYRETNN